MNSKTLQFSLLAAILASTAAVGAAIISENDEVLRKAKIQIIDRKFQDAANALAADPGTGEQAQERRYLRGHALLLANDAAGATQVFESYLKDFPNGLDATRARHGIAAANRIQKNFDGAANILRDELKKLLSPARRMDLAKVYIEYAERAEKGAAPNFTRARSFYDLALTLELPPVDDERIRTKAAEMSEKLNDNPDALQRLLYVQKTHGAGKDGITKFRVAELQRKSGDAFGARRAYRDFLKDYSSSEKAVEAAYGIGLTFGMPQPPSDEMLALGVAAFQELILKFPAHDLSRKAAFEIALAEFQRGRFDDAIRDFQAFVSSGKKDEKDDRIAVARATVGDAYYRQSKFTEAIAAWKLYLSEHPTHGGFARVHKSIVDAEHSIAMKAASDALENSTKARELGDAARAAIQTFLAAHPLDARHASTAMQLAKIEETRERYDVAREEFERIVSKYAGSNESSEGQYHVGRIYEEKTFDYEKAIDSYKKVKGAYQPAAAARLAALQSKSLALRTKRTFRSDEDPSVEISSRNIEKLRFRAYKLDLEVFFRAKLATPAIEPLDVEVIAADVRRDAVTENYIAHKETTRAVGLPEFKGKPGAYVVKVDDGEFEATSLVIISDLVIITKGMKNGVLVFAQNARTGDPVRDARLVISDGKSILLEEKTGADGVLSRPSAWKDPVSNLVVYGSSEGGAAVSGMDLRSLATVESLKERSIIISDRSSYRPGDTVKMWAVSRSVHNNSYAIEEGRDVKLILADPSGVTIRSADAKLSAFGTAASNFEIPASGAFGTWTLQVRDVTNKNVLGSRGVEVEETRRDRIRVELNLEKAVVMRGDAVKGTVKVRYFSGGPAAKRSITITLQENDPISLTTDEAGNVNFTLETRELAEEGLYPIVARVEEEGVFGVSELAVATVEFRPLLKIAQPVVLANEAFDVSIETKDAGRKPIAADLQLSVFKIEERGNRKTQTLAGKTNEKTGEGNVRITIPDGGRYFVRAEGKDRFGTPVFADAAIEVSGDDDAQKLRIFTERENWKLGESFKARVVSRLLNTKKTLMTFEGNGILEYKIIDVPKGETTLEFPMMENLAPQCTFALAAVDEWKLYYAQKTIRVSKQLNIEIAAPKDPLAPGSAAEASVIVQDAQGRPVASEVALAIVDSAFLAKRGDNNSRLHDFFFASSRAAGTRTASSCGFEYSAPTKRVAKDLAAEEDRQMQEKLRSDERAKSLDRANGFVANDPTGNYKGPSDTLAAAPSTPASGDSAEPMSNSILEDESRGELKDQIDSLGYVGGGGNSGGGGAYRGPTGGSRNMTVRGGKSRSAVTKTGQVAGRPSAKPGASKDKKAEAGEILESMQQLDLDVEGLSWRGLAVELEDGSVRQPVARSNFNETAEFAIVTTDAEGRGKLKFTLPDSTT
ncbi:MAG: MG2 domain-containing protein, partial [Planctomycetota bacterium]